MADLGTDLKPQIKTYQYSKYIHFCPKTGSSGPLLLRDSGVLGALGIGFNLIKWVLFWVNKDRHGP